MRLCELLRKYVSEKEKSGLPDGLIEMPYAIKERAAIMEIDGGMDRQDAVRQVLIAMANENNGDNI